MRLTIESDSASGKKGREFSANLLASVEADFVWQGGMATKSASRPVWLAVAASSGALAPFLANMRTGRTAVQVDGRSSGRKKGKPTLECPRGARYAWHVQRVTGGDEVAYGYLPELFALDPGMVDEDTIRFVALYSQLQVPSITEEQFDSALQYVAKRHPHRAERLLSGDPKARRLVVAAVACMTFLRSRSTIPMPNHVGLCTNILLMALSERLAYNLALVPWSNSPSGLATLGLEELRVEQPTVWNSTHEDFISLAKDAFKAHDGFGPHKEQQ